MVKEIKVRIQVNGGNGGAAYKDVLGRLLTEHFVASRYQAPESQETAYNAKLWNVTHLPTGFKIATVTSLKKAKNIAKAAERCMPNVGSSDTHEAVKDTNPQLLEYRRTDASLTFDEFLKL